MRLKIHSVIACIYKRDYSTGGKGMGASVTYRQTDPPTKRVLEEHLLLKNNSVSDNFLPLSPIAIAPFEGLDFVV